MENKLQLPPIYFYTTDITIAAGIERITLNLSNWFVRKGYDVTIVSNFKTNANPAYPADSKIHFVFLSETPFGGSPGSVSRLKKFISNVGRVRSYFKNVRNVIIISQAFPNSFTYFLAMGKRNGNNVYTVEHVQYFYYGKAIRALRKIVYKKYGHVVTLTKRDYELYCARKIPVCRIPNGMEIPVPENCVRQKKVVGIGRLDVQKNFCALIKVFAELHEEFPEWTLEIYGTGILHDDLKSLISFLKADSYIFLKGLTSDVNHVLSESSVFALSSLWEGFPMVLLEAMSNGIACASYDCPTGPGELITDGVNGLLVEEKSEDGLHDALKNLMSDDKLRIRLGAEAQKTAVSYSMENVGNMWLKMFSNL